MSTEIKEKSVKHIVVGYTLDAVLEAHNLAMNEENDVEFYCTGELGEPLDKYNDFISYEDARRIGFILHGCGYEEISNAEWMYIPFDKLKFENSRNGLIQLPFNKNSFDNEEEWLAVLNGFNHQNVQDILHNVSNSPTRLITMFKQHLPKWFVDSIIRNVNDTRWKNVPTSSLTLNGYTYEFNLNKIGLDVHEKWYKPELTFKHICERILKTDNITIKSADKKMCFEFITNRNIENVTFMDNRIDYYMDYRLGMFDRREMCYEIVDSYPEFLNEIYAGYVNTPTMDCWGYSKYNNEVRKLTCKEIKSIMDVPVSHIPMTKNNLRMYDAYSKILPLYGKNKNLNLNQKIKTLIK